MSYQYDPLKWPPDLQLAELHQKCSRPGIDNTEGARCPCCERLEKLENSKWPTRDIIKDFKNYGGGVPAYFYFVKYFAVCLLILLILVVGFHMYLMEVTCPTFETDPYQQNTTCDNVFKIIQFCDSNYLYWQLIHIGKATFADIFIYLQLAEYFFLVIATICLKIWLQHLNYTKINKEEKILSKFSLIIKNIPLYYQMEDLKKQILKIGQNIQICEMFYVYKTAEYDKHYRELFDMYYQIKHLETIIEQSPTQQNYKLLKGLYEKYLKYEVEVQNCKEHLTKSTKRVVIVFNKIEDREAVQKSLRMSELTKFFYYTFRMVGIKLNPISYYTEKIVEPEEVHWRYIGESSTHKAKVRLETTFIGIGFMLICFGLFYFPMIYAKEERINDPSIGTLEGLVISLAIIILANVYRWIIIKLMPTRRPSSRLAESYFIVMTTVVFHFFFYLVSPAIYYVFASGPSSSPPIPQNAKLKELFLAVFLFMIMQIIIAAVDVPYLMYKKRKNKLLGSRSEANNYCQLRLHEELNSPGFPIQFKLMVVLNVWLFNAFYIFALPSLVILFLVVLFILFWIDKMILYKHYKMQTFISIELQLKIQKLFIILFVVCASIGYAISAVFLWQKLMTVAILVIAVILNLLVNLNYKNQKHQDMKKKNTTLKHAIEQFKINSAQNIRLQLLQNDLKSSFVNINLPDKQSEISIATQHFKYGYQEIYNRYLNQFKNKEVNDMLSKKAIEIQHQLQEIHTKMGVQDKKRKQSEMVYVDSQKEEISRSLNEKLISEHADKLSLNVAKADVQNVTISKLKVLPPQGSHSSDEKEELVKQQPIKEEQEEVSVEVKEPALEVKEPALEVKEPQPKEGQSQ